MDKLPAFQFYPGDWRKDPGVQALDYETRGIWFEILLLMHESEERGKLLLNNAAMPDEALAQILGLNIAKVQQTLSKLLSYGVASLCQTTGALMNRRMCKDEYLRQVRAAAGSEGGKQKASKASSKRLANPTPSSSSSSSSSSSDKNKEEDILSSSCAETSGFARAEQNQNGRRAKREKKKPDLPVSLQALDLATKLKDSILTNTPGTIAPTLPALQQWAVDIDKLNRLDGKTWEQIEWLLAWSQKDPFWSRNIQSGGKFRKQWNQLLAKASAEQPRYSAPLTEEELLREDDLGRLMREAREKKEQGI